MIAGKLRLPDMEREIKGEVEHLALVSRAQERLDEVAGPRPDRINP